MILDFSQKEFILPTPIQESWKKEIIEFIFEYSNQKQIKVQTSGSTGKPKEIFLSKKNVSLSARLTGDFLDLKEGNTAILALPIQYIAGKLMVVRAIELKLKLICLPPKTEMKWEGSQADFIALTPMQAEKSLELIKKCEKVILGGAKVNEELEKMLSTIPNKIYETYGMTETITHIAMRRVGMEKNFHVLPQMQVSQNRDGCLVILTPYFKHKIVTNDLVELVSPESFRLLGRKDNMINSGGLKINPEEIEALLKPYISVPFIIHSVPDAVLGQKVVLVVESEKPIQLVIPNNVIPKNKFFREVFYIPEFPRTLSGKIKRKEVLR